MKVIKFTYKTQLKKRCINILKYLCIIAILLFSCDVKAQNQWTQMNDIPRFVGHIQGAVGFSFNGRAIVGLGTQYGFGTIQQDIWEYNYINDTWTQKNNFNKFSGVNFVIGSKAYMNIGQTYEFWEYDSDTDVWTRKSDIPISTYSDICAVAIGTKGYIGLGTFSGLPYKQWWEYDPTLDTWTRKADYPDNATRAAIAKSVGTKAYVGIGYVSGSFNSTNWYEYDQTTNQWTQKASYPGSVPGSGSAIGFTLDNKIYAGISWTNLGHNKLWMFNPTNNTWSRKLDFPGGHREESAVIVIGGKAYVTLGLQSGTNNVWRYNPSTIPTVSSTNAVTSVLYNTAICGGTVSSDGTYTITTRGIVVSTNISHTISDLVFYSTGSLGSFSTTLSGLNSKTTYYARAFATNAFGTSYGPQVTFTTLPNPEDFAPNNGDGNNDGIQDSQQDYVHSFFNQNTQKYITIVSLDNYPILSPSIQLPNENLYYYPGGLVKFTIAQSQANVKIIYHGIQNLDGYRFRKLDSNGDYFFFRDAIFSAETIAGKRTATVRFTLTDGGIGDFDGIENGEITDPGGPAILAINANIPTLSEWAKTSLILILLVFGVWYVKFNNIVGS